MKYYVLSAFFALMACCSLYAAFKPATENHRAQQFIDRIAQLRSVKPDDLLQPAVFNTKLKRTPASVATH